MAETIMTFTLGFLLAALIALTSAVPFWRRAVQITKKRLLAVTPQSSGDVAADRDRLRAEFAMSTRKLERSIGSLRDKTHNQVLQIAQRAKDARALKEELSQKSKTTGQQEAEIGQLTKALAQIQAKLDDQVDENSGLKGKAAEIETLVARQAGIIKEAKTRVDAASKEVADLGKTVKTTSAALEKTRTEIAERDEKLGSALRIAAERKESIGDLTKELTALKKTSARVEGERDDLAEKYSRQMTESKLRISALTAAGTKVERELKSARETIADLTTQVQTATEQRDALSKRTQKDAAILREQMADLTSKVDKATNEIEKVGTDAGLANDLPPATPTTPAMPATASAKTVAAPVKKDLATTLAERIRSLQEHQNQRV